MEKETILKKIEESKKDKAENQEMVRGHKEDIAGWQREINDPSTDKEERARIKTLVQHYEVRIQLITGKISEQEKAISSLQDSAALMN